MYLVDTNVLSEMRKGNQANRGVRSFARAAITDGTLLFVSAISIGELRRGVELIRHRGDVEQAVVLERWLTRVCTEYGTDILPFDHDAAQVWGRLRVPQPENALDKQIAATALIHDLAVVTRNTGDFAPTGVRSLNPFT